MTTNFLEKGTDIIKTAVIKDNDEKLEEAVELYVQGVQWLLKALKYEKSAQMKGILNEKINKYLKRAEDIKTTLNNKEQPKKKALAGG